MHEPKVVLIMYLNPLFSSPDYSLAIFNNHYLTHLQNPDIFNHHVDPRSRYAVRSTLEQDIDLTMVGHYSTNRRWYRTDMKRRCTPDQADEHVPIRGGYTWVFIKTAGEESEGQKYMELCDMIAMAQGGEDDLVLRIPQ